MLRSVSSGKYEKISITAEYISLYGKSLVPSSMDLSESGLTKIDNPIMAKKVIFDTTFCNGKMALLPLI